MYRSRAEQLTSLQIMQQVRLHVGEVTTHGLEPLVISWSLERHDMQPEAHSHTPSWLLSSQNR
jgi:hypothetical protein